VSSTRKLLEGMAADLSGIRHELVAQRRHLSRELGKLRSELDLTRETILGELNDLRSRVGRLEGTSDAGELGAVPSPPPAQESTP